MRKGLSLMLNFMLGVAIGALALYIILRIFKPYL